jgi:hypothetical protein
MNDDRSPVEPIDNIRAVRKLHYKLTLKGNNAGLTTAGINRASKICWQQLSLSLVDWLQVINRTPPRERTKFAMEAAECAEACLEFQELSTHLAGVIGANHRQIGISPGPLLEFSSALDEELGRPPLGHANIVRLTTLRAAAWNTLEAAFRAVNSMAATAIDLSAGTEGATPKRKRLSPGTARDLIIATLDSFAAEGKWDVEKSQIMRRAGVPRTTYDRVCERPDVRKAMRRYRERQLGKGPVHVDDI